MFSNTCSALHHIINVQERILKTNANTVKCTNRTKKQQPLINPLGRTSYSSRPNLNPILLISLSSLFRLVTLLGIDYIFREPSPFRAGTWLPVLPLKSCHVAPNRRPVEASRLSSSSASASSSRSCILTVGARIKAVTKTIRNTPRKAN